jgi:hypothetical protein
MEAVLFLAVAEAAAGMYSSHFAYWTALFCCSCTYIKRLILQFCLLVLARVQRSSRLSHCASPPPFLLLVTCCWLMYIAAIPPLNLSATLLCCAAAAAAAAACRCTVGQLILSLGAPLLLLVTWWLWRTSTCSRLRGACSTPCLCSESGAQHFSHMLCYPRSQHLYVFVYVVTPVA